MGMRPVAEQFRPTQLFRDNLTQYNLGAGHGAIDFATPIGTPVVASADGVVTFADWSWNLPGDDSLAGWASRYYQIKAPLGNMRVGGGIMVTLDHGNSVTPYVTVNAHLSKTDLNPGQRVRKGQIIGYTGNTGSSTGPHLHFALLWKPFAWNNGYYGGIDPARFILEPFKIAVSGGLPESPRKDAADVFLQGIDVSDYQPADIVTKVKSDFVIVKTTESASWTARNWERQLADARRLGKRVGVYHFARPLRNSSSAEVKHFYDTVKHADSKDLIWFLDWEEEGAYNYTEWARAFMAELDQKTGKQTGLYANTKALTTGVWTAKDRARPLWRAFPVLKGTAYATSFNLPPAPGGWSKLVMDQYSFHGRLPGYGADLDLNVYYGGIQQWLAVGSGTASNTDLLEEIMASPAERAALAKEIVSALLTYKNEKVVGKNGPDVYQLLVNAASVAKPVGRKGPGIDPKTEDSLANVVAYNASDAQRDRAEHAETQALLQTVISLLNPSTDNPTEEVKP